MQMFWAGPIYIERQDKASGCNLAYCCEAVVKVGNDLCEHFHCFLCQFSREVPFRT